jgi:hypothetical protein
VQALKQLNVTLTAALNPQLQAAKPQVVQVWFEGDPAVVLTATVLPAPSTVFTIHGTTTFDGTVMLWTRKDDDKTLTSVLQPGGRVLIRIHCGYLLDAQNRTFSAALDTVTHVATTHVPGGVFESWFFVSA